MRSRRNNKLDSHPSAPTSLSNIRSQSDPRRIIEAKMQTWLDNGAQLAWLVDPLDPTVTIYRPNQPPELLLHPETVAGEGPVAGFTLPCDRLWPTP